MKKNKSKTKKSKSRIKKRKQLKSYKENKDIDKIIGLNEQERKKIIRSTLSDFRMDQIENKTVANRLRDIVSKDRKEVLN